MHILQSKHSKLKSDDVTSLLEKYNISLSQLPKMSKDDPSLSKLNIETGDVILIERKNGDDIEEYYRVAI